METIFKDKKVTVMGLGLLGGALNDTIFLAEHGADLIVTDLKTEKELASSVEKLSKFTNITFRLGGHDLEDFKDRDFILQPGNVPLDSPYLLEAKKNNIPVYVSESLFAEHTGATLVGVTGTRGKSTTTHMIYDVLQKTPPKGGKVFLGGNVQNTSTLALLDVVKKEDIVVLELDSWALHGMGDITKSPHVAVFTTFFDDHLNFYKENKGLYLEDKAQIFKNQTESDYLIVSKQAESVVLDTYHEEIESKITIAGELRDDIQLKILGEHNRDNASCAYEVLKILGLSEENIKKGLENFTGVSGRLEYIGEKHGVKIYNDTTATTPEATIAALKALDTGDKNIVLIAGGADKGLGMSLFMREAKARTKEIVLLKGTGTDTVKIDLLESLVFGSLKDAVEHAFKKTETGDVILFSPAFASFGMFANEYERGGQFKEIIKNIYE